MNDALWPLNNYGHFGSKDMNKDSGSYYIRKKEYD